MRMRSRCESLVIAVALTLICALSLPALASAKLPRIDHVFVIWLENENADVTFDPNGDAPYLAKALPRQGLFMPNYYATGHLSLDNYISVVSGQAPNIETQADCLIYNDFFPAIPTADGQFIGQGCVYPAQVKTIANQLEDGGLTWKGYMEDMAAKAPSNLPSERAACRHPEIGTLDDTQSAEAGDQYATRHNPFMYFHSIIDTPSCLRNDVDLNKMERHLEHRRTTANYNFVTPNLCNDGHDHPCVDGEPGGLVSANRWLRGIVPEILDSPAFSHRGLLMVSFDEAEATGEHADSSSCCGELAGPNTPSPGGLNSGPGGGRIGAVLLSPCIKPRSSTAAEYNHYSFLRSVEDNFGVPHLGMAGRPDLAPFGSDVLNRPACGERMRLTATGEKTVGGGQTAHRFRVRALLARCRRGVSVRFSGQQMRTNRFGRASFTAAGPGVATASKRGCRSDRLLVGG